MYGQKYFHFIHAEENCLLTYYGSRDGLNMATIYITSRPCYRCLRMILQKGITNITYAGTTPASCVNDEDLNAQNEMISLLKTKPNIIEHTNVDGVINLFKSTIKYIEHKIIPN